MSDQAIWKLIRYIGFAIIFLVTLIMAGYPQYHVWEQGLVGQAELRRAEQNRQIAVQEATAKKEAAVMLAQAEVERARGVAEANKIIANGLKGHDEYLRYLWITEKAGQGVSREVIYVPTEAQIPIMEASRMKNDTSVSTGEVK